MIRNIAIGALLVALAGAAGTATAGSTNAHKNCWLQDYNRLGHIGGVPIEQVWLHPEFDIRNYKILYIPPVQIDPMAYRRRGEPDRAMAQRLAVALRQELVLQLQGAGIFAQVSDDPYFMNTRRQALTLQLRITEFYSGNANARSFVGLGAGATEVQLEGKLFDNGNDRTFVEFADRRLHSGSALVMGSAATRDAEYLIGIDLKQLMRGIVKLFIYMREEGPLQDQR